MWKYAWIFVRGHYLFWEANSFLRAKLEENCELRGTDTVQGQISEHIFTAKLRLLRLLSIAYKTGEYPRIFCPRNTFRPIAHKQKYLMDYDYYYHPCVLAKLKKCKGEICISQERLFSFLLVLNLHFKLSLWHHMELRRLARFLQVMTSDWLLRCITMHDYGSCFEVLPTEW